MDAGVSKNEKMPENRYTHKNTLNSKWSENDKKTLNAKGLQKIYAYFSLKNVFTKGLKTSKRFLAALPLHTMEFLVFWYYVKLCVTIECKPIAPMQGIVV